MNKEKLVIVLLLITIILSVISVVVTLADTTVSRPTTLVKEKDSGSAIVGFGVVPPTTGSAG